MTTYRKKLIEVALPLEAINKESAREKSIRHGHPSTLHLWWARRPLAACRAVLFASLVDDPDSDPAYARYDPQTREHRAGEKRQQLFALIEELVKWENSSNELVINAARAEIARCVASRKLELGELRKTDPLPGGETVYDLVIKGHGDLPMLRTHRTRLPNAASVNHFLATHAPPVLDPFCGGGSIPLEAQRLGLRAFGSDLNPVPVLITKALIEIPPRFAGQAPVNPESRGQAPAQAKKGKGRTKFKEVQGQLADGAFSQWKGAAGLAEDVRYYGRWIRDEAQKRIGRLYPKITVTEAMARDRKDLKEYVGQELTVIAWLWARTVPSPNPAAAGAHVPLVRTFWLSTKEGKKAWVEPVVMPDGKSYKFEVRTGTPAKDFDPKKGTVIRTGGTCFLTGQPIPFDHIRAEGKAGRMGDRLMAIVAEGARGRVYLSPSEDHEKLARSAKPKDYPDTPLPEQALSFRVMLYGMDRHYKLFTPRQLTALTTFSDLVMEARAKVLSDARGAGPALASAASKGGITGTKTPFVGTIAPNVGTNGANPAGITPNPGTIAPIPGTKTPNVGTIGAKAGTKTPPAGTGAPSVGMNGASEGAAATGNGVSEAAGGAESYADAVATYLAFLIDKMADLGNALNRWEPVAQCPRQLFARQAIPMIWDFAEANPLGESSGSWEVLIENLMRSFAAPLFSHPRTALSIAKQGDATASGVWPSPLLYSTDPPYYDNIGYADLSDFFYVWLRRTLGTIYPDLFRTVLTPKAEELIATPYRHENSKDKAMTFFETGLGRAFQRMRESEHPDYPLSVFYAFKQSEGEEDDADEESDTGTASTGWETMLEGLIGAGLAITGTWPIRTEMGSRMVGQGTNALASSIVLVCHPRPESAPMASRREFVTALKRELPAALRDLQSGNIAPVDLAQAAIGPGMAVYSRYSKVLETSGDRMGVRTALALINQVLDEVLAEQEGEYDADTRWCIKWFEQFAHNDGPYGDAETLCKAMAVGVNGLQETGVIAAKSGKVRLFKRTELMGGKPETWDPAKDNDILHWEVCQYLCWALETGGEQAAADLYRKIEGAYAGATAVARDLAYRLYTVCERKKWAGEALAYNGLVVAWPEIGRLAQGVSSAQGKTQETLFQEDR